jgi:uncharacterized glyoxalase superfamily protein PhnB
MITLGSMSINVIHCSSKIYTPRSPSIKSCAELNARGVTLIKGTMNRPWGVRTASFADPDGHIWEIAQQLT